MRIMIFGRPGSGKSTYSNKLSEETGILVYHLDKYFFVNDWIERDYQEFLTLQQELVDKDSWIIDGNSTRSLEMRYHRATIVLYFCFPKIVCLFRLVKRLFSKDFRIDDRAPGCKENVRWCLIKYMWTFEDRVKGQIAYLQKNYPEVQFYKIMNGQELQQVNKKVCELINA
jgi:adenylate kinase family enzyme